MIPAGHYGRTGWRTESGGVKIVVQKAVLGQLVDTGCFDQSAVGTYMGKTDIV
jgi:hypothetical protein